jgi:hypothetical protein
MSRLCFFLFGWFRSGRSPFNGDVSDGILDNRCCAEYRSLSGGKRMPVFAGRQIGVPVQLLNFLIFFFLKLLGGGALGTK